MLSPRSSFLVLSSLALSLAVMVLSANAEAQIKQPGAHPSYDVELEPHLVLDWGGHPGPDDDDALGLGLRAAPAVLQAHVGHLGAGDGVARLDAARVHLT